MLAVGSKAVVAHGRPKRIRTPYGLIGPRISQNKPKYARMGQAEVLPADPTCPPAMSGERDQSLRLQHGQILAQLPLVGLRR